MSRGGLALSVCSGNECERQISYTVCEPLSKERGPSPPSDWDEGGDTRLTQSAFVHGDRSSADGDRSCDFGQEPTLQGGIDK